MIPVEYGVKRDSEKTDSSVNREATFEHLAAKLDQELTSRIESPALSLRRNWAFTRYDIVGHSQGGVLVRMLCNQVSPQSLINNDFMAFRSARNFFRGRFHRIITIGSPHNGSRFAYYGLKLRVLGILNELWDWAAEKFDPFGAQMQRLSAGWRVDPTAKFNLIGSWIYDGHAPPIFRRDDPPPNPPIPAAYVLTLLTSVAPGSTDRSRGSIVLPAGSDGVVDLASQLAVASSISGVPHTPITLLLPPGDNTAHSGPEWLFGVPNGDTESARVDVATRVLALLDGPNSAFGSFVRIPLPPGSKAEIDSAIPGGVVPKSNLRQISSARNASIQIPSADEVYRFELQVDPAEPVVSPPVWSVEVYGPNGVVTDGVTIVADPENILKVSVMVAADVIGELILRATYATVGHRIVVSTPISVISRPAGASITGLYLVPQEIEVTTGVSMSSQIWAKYDNGAESELYIPPQSQLTYSTSDAAVATVDARGNIFCKSPGTAKIAVHYLGFASEMSLFVIPQPEAPVPGASAQTLAPVITLQPQTQTVNNGDAVTLTVQATGAAALTYQWLFNGVDIAGAIGATLSIFNVAPQDLGNYSVVVKNNYGSVISEEAKLRLPERTLANISTRLKVGTGDDALIGGFIVTGAQPKKIIVRGIGPSLPLADKLINPTLELRDSSGTLLDSNDDWQESPNKQAIIDSTIPPTNDLEAAIVATLPANNAGYTAIVRGKDNGIGIGVIEAYDLDRSVDSKLANISTRGFVQTGDNVLIAGTIVVGQVTQKVIVRAIGPSLTGLGVSGALQDPTLELRDGNGALVRSNDNWRSDQEAEIIATTIPPTNDFESAIVTTLPSNGASYTAIVRGVNNTTGIAVVEVYGLD